MLKEMLAERRISDLFTFENGTPVTADTVFLRQEELRHIMLREVYGKMPAAPSYIKGEVISEGRAIDFAGKASRREIRIEFGVEGKVFSFPIKIVMPKKIERPPFAVIINFRPNVPDDFIPAEELVDNGLAFASFCYNDVATDDNDFSNGLAGVLEIDRTKADATGKIALWAYAASRVLDYVLENETINMEKIAVCGHSRLGKTALLAGAFDSRFTYVYSNNSGCSGAAITRNKEGERVENITKMFPYWFCPRYTAYAGKEDEMPFDQHFLLAASAPRKVYVASAKEDIWADPVSEFLSAVATSDFYTFFDKIGFACPDRLPTVGDAFHEGNIGYHLRDGMHSFSREDWNIFLRFFMKRNM